MPYSYAFNVDKDRRSVHATKAAALEAMHAFVNDAGHRFSMRGEHATAGAYDRVRGFLATAIPNAKRERLDWRASRVLSCKVEDGPALSVTRLSY